MRLFAVLSLSMKRQFKSLSFEAIRVIIIQKKRFKKCLIGRNVRLVFLLSHLRMNQKCTGAKRNYIS